KTDHDVPADAGLRPVKHRPQLKGGLERTEGALVSGHATIPTNGHETVPTSGHENSPPLAISKACSEAAAKECGCDQAAQSDCGKEQAKGGSGSRTHRGATTFASARTQRIGHQPPASPRPQDRAQVPAAAGSGGPACAAHLQTDRKSVV